MQKRRVIYGAGFAASILLIIGILIVVALLANWRYARWDITQGRTQSLSAVTKALLKEINQPLTMTGFLPEGSPERQNAKDILSRYADQNPKVSFNFVDPERDPLKAKEAGFRFPGNVFLTYEGRRQMADRADEETLTNAVRKILKPERKLVFFLTGHGERDITKAGQGGFQVARRALENEGYEIKLLNLLTQAEVPKDAAVVVVAAPKKALLGSELGALKSYLDRGGRILVLLEPFEDAGLNGTKLLVCVTVPARYVHRQKLVAARPAQVVKRTNIGLSRSTTTSRWIPPPPRSPARVCCDWGITFLM